MSREAEVTTPDRVYPRAEAAAALPDHLHRRWSRYGGNADATYFAALLGLVVEDVRVDYCRMRLPWRTEISQPFGVSLNLNVQRSSLPSVLNLALIVCVVLARSTTLTSTSLME